MMGRMAGQGSEPAHAEQSIAYRKVGIMALTTAATAVTSPLTPSPKRNLFPYAWMAPALLFILVGIVVPLVYTVYISGTNYDQAHLYNYHWVGLRNYGYAFSTDPYTGYAHGYLWLFAWTLVFALSCTVVNIGFG